MSQPQEKNPKFNDTLARAYQTSRGDFMSVDIDSEVFDALQKVEIGGRLSLKIMKVKKTDKSPDAYFEYMTPQKVRALKDFLAIQRAQVRSAPPQHKAPEDVV